jgi:hypothetical protein
MRIIPLCLVFLTVSGLYNRLSAQDYKLAVGIRFSTAAPTLNNSLSVKYFIDQSNAVEGLVSFGSRFGIGGLYEKHQLIGGTPAFTFFYGGGAYVGFESGQTWFGPTGVIGLDYKFPNAPVNLSLDWKPELDLLPAINFVPDAFGLTARFTFASSKGASR